MSRARLCPWFCGVPALLAGGAARAEPAPPTARPIPRFELAAPTLLAPAGAPVNAAQRSYVPPASVVNLAPLPTDYNAADPDRGVSNHLRALFGTFAINWVIWQYDWLSTQREIFFVTRETMVRNFETGFVYDDNTFKTNFFGHPFHGSMYMGAARGAGLSFWESLPYPWFGSFMWEFTSERHLPAPNDWIATSWGGTIIGEALFRLANEVFDDSLAGGARFWSELGGTVVSPMYGLQRLTSGRSTSDGPPPRRRRRLDADFLVGASRVRLNAGTEEDKSDPGLLIGLNLEYGDLLPKPGESHIGPFEFFELSAGFNLLQGETGGSHLFIEAPMYGWNTYLSDPEDPDPDNNVFAITQFFDFQGANVAQFGGAGLGIGDYLVWRLSHDLRYRISGNLQAAFLSGATSPFTAATGRTYNFTLGGTADLVSRLDSKKLGELSLRARQYLTTVIDGEDGNELTGYFRFSYELPTFHGWGVGVASTLVNRRGDYEELGTTRGYAFTNEIFGLFEL